MKEIATGDNHIKTIRQQQRDGEWYEALGDAALIHDLHECEDLCFEYNNILPSKAEERDHLIRRILGKVGVSLNIHSPFHCDFGYNIEIGDYFFANLLHIQMP